MRRAARIDITQSAIVEALRDKDDYVWPIGRPVDLLVGSQGCWWTLECKGTRPKKIQAVQHVHAIEAQKRNLPHFIATSVEEALHARDQVMAETGRLKNEAPPDSIAESVLFMRYLNP